MGLAELESILEEDFLTLLEFDRTVDRYEVQPVTVQYTDAEGKPRHYTLDVLIHYRPAEEVGDALAPRRDGNSAPEP